MAVNEHRYKFAVRDTESSPGIPDRGWVDMDVRWLITKDTVGASKTVFGVTFFPAGAKHDIHRHPNAEEVCMVVAGRARHEVAGNVFEMGAGDVCFIPRGEPHSLACLGEQELEIVWVWGGASSMEAAGFVPAPL